MKKLIMIGLIMCVCCSGCTTMKCNSRQRVKMTKYEMLKETGKVFLYSLVVYSVVEQINTSLSEQDAASAQADYWRE